MKCGGELKNKMRGIILAGGNGTRLWPLTSVTNKHLVPVDKVPMIDYPLNTLIKCGIKTINVVAGGEHFQDVQKYLVENYPKFNFGAHYQSKAGGIAQALALTENFVGENSKLAVILGDNIFEDNFYGIVRDFEAGGVGTLLFLKKVPDPERFGVAKMDCRREKIISIEEKPKNPKSNLAVTGFYLYDNTIFDKIRKLKPSARGELEITDVNKMYLEERKLGCYIMSGFWSDAGTHESRLRAEEYIRKVGLEKFINKK